MTQVQTVVPRWEPGLQMLQDAEIVRACDSHDFAVCIPALLEANRRLRHSGDRDGPYVDGDLIQDGVGYGLARCFASERGAFLLLDACEESQGDEHVPKYLRSGLLENFSNAMVRDKPLWCTRSFVRGWVERLLAVLPPYDPEISYARRRVFEVLPGEGFWGRMLTSAERAELFKPYWHELLIDLVLPSNHPDTAQFLEVVPEEGIDMLIEVLLMDPMFSVRSFLGKTSRLAQALVGTTRLSREQVAKLLTLPLDSRLRLALAQRGIRQGR